MARNAGKGHGLFGCLKLGSPLTEFPDWKEVARLVYQNAKWHVTMYRSVVSFEEETAKELRLADQKAWQRYIENHIRTIAEKNGIRRENFSWAAALHPEKGHPHVHVVFWDNSEERAKIKNPFTHPSVPDSIRRQMIKDTFVGQLRAYGEEKNRAAAEMRRLGDGLTDDFERHIRYIGRKKYQKLLGEPALEAELSDAFDFGDKVLDEVAAQVFKIKATLPKSGRIAYQLLPPEVKKQVDALVVLLLSGVPSLREQKEAYIESKMKMVYLYGGSETYLASRREMFGAEADKIIANRVMGMVKMLNRLEGEGRRADYLQSRRQDFAGRMLVEMLDLLDGMSEAQERKYAECLKNFKRGGGGLSKEARRELYLRNQDKGYEH